MAKSKTVSPLLSAVRLLVLAGVFSGTVVNAQPGFTVPEQVELLKHPESWTQSQVREGMVLLEFNRTYPEANDMQVVNVLGVDLSHLALEFYSTHSRDSLSGIGENHPDYLAGINGTYYEIVRNLAGDSVRSSFFKTDGRITTSVSVPWDHQLGWKHEGAFYYDDKARAYGITFGNNAYYSMMPYRNVISGSPMLIYDGLPVGAEFARQRDVPLDSLHYEDPDRHQGVRHPRTAIAITDDGLVLLITVDGRRPESVGMSARELTNFLAEHFHIQYALNLDGGGSTTMWIDGYDTPNSVVNFPTDNRQYDHFGQRRIRSAILVKPK